jgi:hypothetical protein
MRDHLLALQEIDVALSQNAFDKAGASRCFLHCALEEVAPRSWTGFLVS